MPLTVLTQEDLISLTNSVASLVSRVASLEVSRTEQATLNSSSSLNVDNAVSRISSLENRTAQAETSLANDQGRLNSLELSRSDQEALNAVVNSNVDSLASRATGLETRATSLEASDVAMDTRLDDLESRMTAAENKIDNRVKINPAAP